MLRSASCDISVHAGCPPRTVGARHRTAKAWAIMSLVAVGLVRGQCSGTCRQCFRIVVALCQEGTTPVSAKTETDDLTRAIESGTFCDKPGGCRDQFRADVAAALGV